MAAAVIFTTTVVIPFAKWKIDKFRTKRKLKKLQKEITRNLNEESEEEAE